jgi:hypothetical protein
VFQRGTSFVQNAIMSTMMRIEGRGREDPLLLGDVLLENVVLDGPRTSSHRAPCLRATARYIASRTAAGAIDGHGSGDLREGNRLEEILHVLQGVDGHAFASHLPDGSRSSESSPIRVGMSKATDKPVCP